MNIWQLIKVGGFTMIVLLGASVVSIAIILERIIAYRKKSKIKRKDFMLKIRQELRKENISLLTQTCQSSVAPFAQVVYAGLSFFNS